MRIENGKYMISITALYLKNFVRWGYAISKSPSAALEKRIRMGSPSHNCGGRCLLIAHVRDGRIIRQHLCEHGYIPNMLSRSRFNRRLHRIADLFLTLFLRLGEHWKNLNERSVYVIDSYPMAVCENYRIPRSKIYHGEDWRGYIASKKSYFYGLRIHIMVTEQGEPVEFFLAPGAWSDTSALSFYNFDVPDQSWITDDKAYNDYTLEDLMREAGVELRLLRKKNSLRPVHP